MIEANATYRGWFTGGEQGGGWGNAEFVAAHVAGRGSLGFFFAKHLRGSMKMGDTPSVMHLFGVEPEHPARGGWGGKFVRAVAHNDGRALRFRFSPRDAKVWPFTITSDVKEWDGASGAFTAVPPPPERTSVASARHPNWWLDDPAPEAAEGVHPGAKHVSRCNSKPATSPPPRSKSKPAAPCAAAAPSSTPTS